MGPPIDEESRIDLRTGSPLGFFPPGQAGKLGLPDVDSAAPTLQGVGQRPGGPLIRVVGEDDRKAGEFRLEGGPTAVGVEGDEQLHSRLKG